MPGAFFDITGDNSNIIEVINDTIDKVKVFGDEMQKLGSKGLDLSDAEHQIASLKKEIKESESTLNDYKSQMKDLADSMKEAAMSGNTSEVERLGLEMKTLATKTQEAAMRTEVLKTMYQQLGPEIDRSSQSVQSFQAANDKMQEMADVFSDLRGLGINFDDMSAAAAQLREVLKVNAQEIMTYRAQIDELYEKQRQAVLSGDSEAVAEYGEQIAVTATKLEQYTVEAQKVSNALDMIRNNLDVTSLSGFSAEIAAAQAQIKEAQLTLETLAATDSSVDLSTTRGQISALTDAINHNKKEIKTYEKALEDLQDAQEAAFKSGDFAQADELSGQIIKVADAIQRLTSENEKYAGVLKTVQDGVEKTTESHKSQEGIMAKLVGGQEQYNAIIKLLPSPLKNVVSGINGITKASLKFIATPIGAVVAALVLAYQALTTWLHKSSEGQQALAKISGYVSGALNALSHIAMQLGKSLYKAFTDPKKAVSDLWKSIKTNLLNRLQGMAGVFINFGKVIGNALTLDFDEAGKAAKEMGNSLQKIFTGKDISDIKEDADNFKQRISFIKDTAKAESDLNVRRNKLHRERTAWMTEEAEYDKKITEERNKMMIGSNEERKKAAARMQELINEKYAKEIAMAKEEYDIKRSSNALTESSQEDLDEEQRLLAHITQLETQRESSKRMALRIESSMGKAAVSAANQLYKLDEKRVELKKQLAEMKESSESDAASLRIQAMRDGFDKELAELDHEHDERVAKIRKQYQDTLDKIEKLQKEQYVKKHGSYSGFVFNPNDEDAKEALHIAMQQLNNEDRSYNLSKFSLAITNEYKSALSSAEDYESRRIAITSEASEKIERLKKQEAELNELLLDAESEEEAERIEEEIVRNKRAQQLINRNTEKSLEKLDDTYSDFYKKLAKDRSKWLVGDTVDLLKEAERKLEALGSEESAGDDKDKVEQIQRLRKEVENLKKELSASFTPSGILKQLLMPTEGDAKKGFAERIQDLRDAWEKMTTEDKWKTVGGYVSKIGGGLQKAADYMKQIAELSGDKRLSDTAGELNAVAQNFTAAGQGAASGGWIGAIVGGAADILSQTIEAIANAGLQEEIAKKNAEDWAYALETVFLNIDESKFKTIFGEKSIGLAQENFRKATKSLSMYEKKLREINDYYGEKETYNRKFSGMRELLAYTDALNKGYSGLQRMLITTKKQSDWARFWGAEDEYTALGELAPELWDKNGELVIENAKKFLEVNTQISDEQKKQIEQLIELKEGYDEAMAAIDSTIGETFGSLASDITDVIWDSVMNGSDAWEQFQQIGADAISNLGKQMIQEMLISEYLEQYRDQMREAYKAGSPEETQRQLREVVGSIYGGMEQMLASGTIIAEEYKKWADEHGIDLTSGEQGGDQRTAQTRSALGASQDSVDESNARLTTIQGHTFEINENVKKLAAIASFGTDGIVAPSAGLSGLERDYGSEFAAIRESLAAQIQQSVQFAGMLMEMQQSVDGMLVSSQGIERNSGVSADMLTRIKGNTDLAIDRGIKAL